MRIRNLFDPGSGMEKKSDPGKKHLGSPTVKKYTRSLMNFTDKKNTEELSKRSRVYLTQGVLRGGRGRDSGIGARTWNIRVRDKQTKAKKNGEEKPKSVLLIRIRVYLAVLWIRIRSAPKILAGSRYGSRKKHSGHEQLRIRNES
jgi:hypothetical protein